MTPPRPEATVGAAPGGGATVWLTGLSGSGKSTVAAHLGALLEDAGRAVRVLDGDDLRDGLNADLGFTRQDRAENVRRVGEVALLFAEAGFVTLVPVISPYAEGRRHVRSRHDARAVAFFEVHVATALEICESRDPKGLYVRARAGEIEQFTGISDPYEVPAAPELRLATEGRSPRESASEVLDALQVAGVVPVADAAFVAGQLDR